MTARETLEACLAKVQQVHVWAILINMIRFPSNGLRTQQWTGMPRGSNDPVRSIAEQLEFAEKGFARASDEMQKLKAAVELLILGLEVRERIIVREYYIEGRTDDEVALRVQISRNRACEIRQEAIEKLCKNA